MTTTLERPSVDVRSGEGGLPARRAVTRWGWRLFRREWRQQVLVLALIVVAVAATVVGATAAVDTQAPANAGFGTARDMATFSSASTSEHAEIAQLEHRYGPVDVIENQQLRIPGSITTYELRSQDPSGPYGGPMLALVSGRYPTGPHEVAVTSGVASAFGLKVGDYWRQGGAERHVVGIVENPQSLLDEFALVAPGQVTAPTKITVLFDGPGPNTSAPLPSNVQHVGEGVSNNVLNPNTIVLALATLGMLLIALVAVGGFTVLAQRRLRSIGMLESLGATDRNVGLVVRANGVVVGVVGTLLGFVLGLGAWLAYRSHAEASSHHLIAPFALPWKVIAPAMVLAVLATYFAASRPARAVTRVPIVVALSGRPAPPKQLHRSVVPGLVVVVIAIVLLSLAGSRNGNGGGAPALVFGLVALLVALILLSPFSLAALARLGRRSPFAIRMAVRDLSRYRSRSGSALAAIGLGVMIAVIICVVAAARYGNVLDYAGPNLASNQLIVYAPNANPNLNGGSAAVTSGVPPSVSAHSIADGLGATGVIALETTSANLIHAAAGRNFSGQVYVATPQLLKAFGIDPSTVDASADILSMRPGLSGYSQMQLLFGAPSKGGVIFNGPQAGGNPNSFPCPRSTCLANPDIQEVAALPSGTSAPNTVITEHAVHQLGLGTGTVGWLIQTAQPLTASEITNAQQAAAGAGMTVETKNDQPTSDEIINWATVFGVVLALGVLAMSVGLIRSETASDLRILTATGASSFTRRSLTAATAGALGLLGAVLGAAAGYLATIAFLRGNQTDGLSEFLGNIPARNLLIIVVVMPLFAAAVGWVLAGREPASMSMQPME